MNRNLSHPRPGLVLVLIVLLSSIALAACSGRQPAGGSEPQMASMQGMPQEVKDAPKTVQAAYQYAVANPDVLKQFPCYCGCGKMGHTSNYSCYVSAVAADGQITYDTHALGCSICVDITQDVMRLKQENKTIPEIQTYIEATYSKYGPSNRSG